MSDKNLASEKITLLMELRRAGILNTHLLSVIEKIPRELFIPQYFYRQAYDNIAISIGYGQTISQPKVVADMIQALEISHSLKILEIGTGSGYMTAILSKLSRRIYTIERIRELMIEAQQRFDYLRIHNITTLIADGIKGWVEQAPFDRIIVSAVSQAPPKALLTQLKENGILIIPIGDVSENQWIMKYKRIKIETNDLEDFTTEKLFPVRFVPLVKNLPKPYQL